jgi:hypothetical protein
MAGLHVIQQMPRECRVTNPETGEQFYGLAVSLLPDNTYRVHAHCWHMPPAMVDRIAAEKPDFTYVIFYIPAKDISFDDVYLT